MNSRGFPFCVCFRNQNEREKRRAHAYCRGVFVLCMKSNCFETHESAVYFATPNCKPGTLKIKECKWRKEVKREKKPHINFV